MSRVVISDKMSPRAAASLAERGFEVDEIPGLPPGELAERLPGAEGLVVRSSTRVDAALMAAAPQLRVVGRAGIGVDNIDVATATARGIVVMNTPFGNTVTTAEHAIAMMFALARQIPAADRSTQAGKWEKSRFVGNEVAEKTLGVIGGGNIGSIVCERAVGLHMRVVVHDPYLSDERARQLGVEKVSFDDLLASADFITLHTPLTDSTRGMIDAAAIARTRPGVRIINCARGGLVVEADLRAALDSGHVAGAACDVFEVEPARECVLFGHENFIATPHLGASAVEAQENVSVQVAAQIADFLETGAIRNAVNAPSVSAEEAPRLRTYMGLAQSLGSLAGQLIEDAPTGIEITYRGQVAEANTRPLTSLALQGILAGQLDSVNMVNAPTIASERGIAIREVAVRDAEGYLNLIEVRVEMGEDSREVSGTLFGEQQRLVRVQDIACEAAFGKHMLFVRNRDRPGFIGKLGTLLGAEGVNISHFHLGRSSAGGGALALVEIDEECPSRVLEKIAAFPDTIGAPKFLRF